MTTMLILTRLKHQVIVQVEDAAVVLARALNHPAGDKAP